ncbi:hypothetical protein J4Q44_G00362100 [Coregonus suidteri]|uniref:Uncharacterized protein n=1 Tax=Coregonus suidteri TaxID=861788 RepID=A0AAN8Q767_9TELE
MHHKVGCQPPYKVQRRRRTLKEERTRKSRGLPFYMCISGRQAGRQAGGQAGRRTDGQTCRKSVSMSYLLRVIVWCAWCPVCVEGDGGSV